MGTVGEESLLCGLWFVSPWGGTSMPWSASAELEVAQPWKSSAMLCLTRCEGLIDWRYSQIVPAQYLGQSFSCILASPKIPKQPIDGPWTALGQSWEQELATDDAVCLSWPQLPRNSSVVPF